jgi:hypothetical protein
MGVMVSPAVMNGTTNGHTNGHTNGINGTNGISVPAKAGGASIIDIRSDVEESSIRDDILSGLQPPSGQMKQMPTLLLYDSVGLKLFEEITYIDEYYLTNYEIELLEHQASSIAGSIEPGSMIVELGSG